jgi:hypothetical protein
MNASRVWRPVRLILVNLLVLIVAAALIEGLASVALLGRWFSKMEPVAERVHTRYDRDLGWANTPGAQLPDIYGPGVGVRINAQGLREDTELSTAVPAGHVRMMCVGDSFTFGYGVSGDQTWCHQLMRLNPKLQTVNMGLGGYGLDQMYLWYKRDGGALQHQITVVAVVTDDFGRMHWDNFIGYPKPKLVFGNGVLAVTNVPVPRGSYVIPWRSLKYRMPLEELAVMRLYREYSPAEEPSVDRQEFEGLLAKVVEELRRLTTERGSQLVLVYLPSAPDLQADGLTDWYMEAFRAAAARSGVPLVDLVSEFRLQKAEEIMKMVIKPGDVPFLGAAAHFNAYGNEVMASRAYRELLAIPGIAALLR